MGEAVLYYVLINVRKEETVRKVNNTNNETEQLDRSTGEVRDGCLLCGRDCRTVAG